MQFAVTADVRQEGATGIFVQRDFMVEAPNEAAVKDEWAKQHGTIANLPRPQRWELYCFISIRRICPHCRSVAKPAACKKCTREMCEECISVHPSIEDARGDTRRETVAENLTEKEAKQLTAMLNKLGERFLPNLPTKR